mmetsp:Transcript_33206/g.88154  ORF Transcript_33206/g.88154 Transcript_33206/m.88154 type:complete len:149 (+) Transcript_33206:82-528(+)
MAQFCGKSSHSMLMPVTRINSIPVASVVVAFVAFASIAVAKVDNIIHEVRFAEVYRHWSASETEKSIYVNAGDMILIRMNENPGTGYRWQIVTDDKDGFDQTLCQLQPTSGFADGIYEPSTSTDGSDDKVVDGVARPYVPPGVLAFVS